MKKILAMLCMITCIFGLTACTGNTEAVEKTQNQSAAETLAQNLLVPMFSGFFDDESADFFLEEYDKYEAEYVMENTLASYGSYIGLDKVYMDGSGILSAITSFNSAGDSMGAVAEVGEVSSEINGDEIIVHVEVKGENKDAQAEIIFTNDLFVKMESAALNVDSSMGELMQRAGLNTLLGMGTVFCVLVLIMAIIFAFALIPKMQAAFSKKKKDTVNVENTVEATVSQIVEKEEQEDDTELVAVIAAAIAASQGAASTDGFVVRSIRKINRR